MKVVYYWLAGLFLPKLTLLFPLQHDSKCTNVIVIVNAFRTLCGKSEHNYIALTIITEHRGRYFVAIVCSSSLAVKSNVVATGAPFVHVQVLIKLYFHAKLV